MVFGAGTTLKKGDDLFTALRGAGKVNWDDSLFKSLDLNFNADWVKGIKYTDFDDDFVKLLAKNVSASELKQIEPENLVHISKKLEGDDLADFAKKLDPATQENLFKKFDLNKPEDLKAAKKLANNLDKNSLNNLIIKFPGNRKMINNVFKKSKNFGGWKSLKDAKKANELNNSQIKDRDSLRKAASSEFSDSKNTEIMEKGAKYRESGVNQENIQRYADDLGDSEVAKNLGKRTDTVNIYNSKPMKSSMKKIGLVGIGALVGVMIMYGEANPFKAIRKAGEDLGKVMTIAKDAAISTAQAAGDTVGGLAKLISWITKNAHIPIVGSVICVVLMLAMYAYSSFSK